VGVGKGYGVASCRKFDEVWDDSTELSVSLWKQEASRLVLEDCDTIGLFFGYGVMKYKIEISYIPYIK